MACAAWALKEVGRAKLGDARRSSRLVEMAAQAAATPDGRVTATFSDAAARQAAYKLLEHGEAPQEAIVGSAAIAAWSRASGPYSFVPIDGSSLTLGAASRDKGYGVVGTSKSKSLGAESMNAVVVSRHGVPLGIAAHKMWTRIRRRREKDTRGLPLEEKETRYWIECLDDACEARALAKYEGRPWFQLDAGADAREVLEWAAWTPSGSYVTVRCGQERCIEWPQQGKLWEAMGGLPIAGRYTLRVPASEKRRAHEALMVVRCTSVVVLLRHPSTGATMPVELFAVHAREEGTCARNDEPVEWLLLTTREVRGFKGAREVIRGYSMRWRVEEVHRSWKSGCGVEKSGLAFSAFATWAALLLCVAVRIERLKRLARETPEIPASSEFTQDEIQALLLLKRKGKQYVAGYMPTIGEAVLWLAELGGYTGKSSGGPPGSTTLKRGLDSLAPTAEALRFQAELRK